MNKLTLPITEADVRNLKAGDLISLSGVVITARDAAHKYMIEQLITGKAVDEDHDIYTDLRSVLRNGAIYHCGPVMEQSGGKWRVIAAGPTTSIREEEYEDQIIEHFGVRAIIGKGGMGPRTLEACRKYGAVYLHAVGGAAAVVAECVDDVLGVWKLDLGIPEAFWQLHVTDMQLLVTIDTHGRSWHAEIEQTSAIRLRELLGQQT